ncbi:uncharacterized protein [Haliotis cracherodii]|uniref:uncharacterized protein n=1 Tax=Haliotis cracherodii TaxID=6455 RepID=UPI0039E9AF05
MNGLKLYLLSDIQSPPVELTRSDGSLFFYSRLPVPLPDSVVLFSLGKFPSNKESKKTGTTLDVSITLGDDRIQFGSLDKHTRCILWEKTKDTAKLEHSNSAVSLAKLCVEVQGGDHSYDSSLATPTTEEEVVKKQENIQEENENTPQLSTPSPLPRKQKKRGRESTDETPEAPSARKQKLNTRMRALKNEFKTPKKYGKKNSETVGTPVLQVNNSAILPKTGPRLSRCKDVSIRAPSPSSRWGSSMCMIHNNRAVLVGGQGDRQQLSRDAVWTLDPDTRRWRSPELTVEGQKTEYRMGHSATYDPTARCIYVYGGSKNLKWFHDVHMLDVDEWKWQLIKVNGKAPTRSYHSATLYRHELWIFGGVYPRPDPNPDGCSNEIHIFSPVMENWYCPIVTGDKPAPRSGHSATLIKDQLVVFGGWDAPICFNDLYILDMGTVDWSKPEVKGMPPKARSWHASCALSNNRILIHGGYDGNNALDDTHIFNLVERSWSCIRVDGAPTARAGHLSICLPYSHENQEEDEVIIFGGGDNDGTFFNDLFSLCIPFKPVMEELAAGQKGGKA